MLLKDFHIGEPIKLKAIVLYSVLGPIEERDSHPSRSPWIPYLPEGPIFFFQRMSTEDSFTAGYNPQQTHSEQSVHRTNSEPWYR